MYLLLRLFGHYSFYTQNKAERICEINGEKASSLFALRSFIEESPYVGIVMMFMILSFYWATLLRLAERGDRIYPDEPNQPTISRLVTLADNLWVIFVTTTTIGYGDIYPITHLGRLIAIIACVVGNVYLGMLVVSLRKELELDKEQHLGYCWISRRYIQEEIKKASLSAIRKAFTLYMLNLKWGCPIISPIKPNPRVVYKGIEIPNDQKFLSSSRYNTKFRIYREMKSKLHQMKMLVKKSREIGESDNDIIKSLGDTVSVDFYDIEGKLKSVVNENRLLEMSNNISLQREIENKSNKIRDVSKLMKRKLTGRTHTTVSPHAPPTKDPSDSNSVSQFKLILDSAITAAVTQN